MKPTKIAFYGLFGLQNWGNECTLQAILYHVRQRFPDAELRCICTDPHDSLRRHNISAYPMSGRFAKGYPTKSRPAAHPVLTLLRKILVGVPRELISWANAFNALRGFDMLLVPGTGLLTDFNSDSFGTPYRVFKWSIVAKLNGCKLLFVSVGAGPAYHGLTRWFVRSALSLADYRSYRDRYSQHFLESIAFKADNDPLYPDLAFSLPIGLFPEGNGQNGRRTVIGVGVKNYHGTLGLSRPGGDAKYHAFIDKLGTLVEWLLANKYTVRLLIGDQLSDNKVKQDLMELLGQRLVAIDEGKIINEPISSVADLLSQLAATDIVVSPRYHNILLALMLNKPAISLSYHAKFAALMDGVGLASYCHEIDNLDVKNLAAQIVELDRQAATLRPHIKEKVEEYRTALDEQYGRIFHIA